VPAGRIYKDGALLIQAEARTVADRKRLGFAGLISVALVINDKGALLADPEVELIGIPDNTADGDPMDTVAYNAVIETFDTLPKPRRRDPDSVVEAIRRGVRAAVGQHWRKKPNVAVHVLVV
jgi:ribonuclease J